MRVCIADVHAVKYLNSCITGTSSDGRSVQLARFGFLSVYHIIYYFCSIFLYYFFPVLFLCLAMWASVHSYCTDWGMGVEFDVGHVTDDPKFTAGHVGPRHRGRKGLFRPVSDGWGHQLHDSNCEYMDARIRVRVCVCLRCVLVCVNSLVYTCED